MLSMEYKFNHNFMKEVSGCDLGKHKKAAYEHYKKRPG